MNASSVTKNDESKEHNLENSNSSSATAIKRFTFVSKLQKVTIINY